MQVRVKGIKPSERKPRRTGDYDGLRDQAVQLWIFACAPVESPDGFLGAQQIFGAYLCDLFGDVPPPRVSNLEQALWCTFPQFCRAASIRDGQRFYMDGRKEVTATVPQFAAFNGRFNAFDSI